MKKYKYFISFNHVNINGSFGFTNAIIDSNKKINNIKIIKAIQDEYKEQLILSNENAKYVAIIDYHIIKKSIKDKILMYLHYK